MMTMNEEEGSQSEPSTTIKAFIQLIKVRFPALLSVLALRGGKLGSSYLELEKPTVCTAAFKDTILSYLPGARQTRHSHTTATRQQQHMYV